MYLATSKDKHTEAVAQRFSVKRVFLKILQNSLENTFGVSFLLKLLAQHLHFYLFKKVLRHRCFPVNFAKFLKALFYRIPLVLAF